MLDKCKAPVCALSFGRLDSALLAFGADDGSVRIASCSEQKASTLHVSGCLAASASARLGMSGWLVQWWWALLVRSNHAVFLWALPC